jgi:type IV fimbrial biogenesis protein FimT
MSARHVPTARLQHGLSLIEQIMVLAIVGVLTSLAVPSLGSLLNSQQVRTAQNDFINGLMNARETAVTSGRRTLFCPTRDGSLCSSEMRWDSGWLLGHDGDGNQQPDRGALQVGKSYAGKVTILSSAGRRSVRFSPDGSAGGSNLTLLFCTHEARVAALSVVVSNAGRIRGAPATPAQAQQCAQLQ